MSHHPRARVHHRAAAATVNLRMIARRLDCRTTPMRARWAGERLFTLPQRAANRVRLNVNLTIGGTATTGDYTAISIS